VIFPEELENTINKPLTMSEKITPDYPLHLIGFKTSSWDAQQAGLSRRDIIMSKITYDADINTEENTVMLDQLQQDRVRRRKMIAMAAGAEGLTNNMPLTFNKAQTFPTYRRPIKRLKTNDPESIVHDWYNASQISVSPEISEGQQEQVERLLYTWKDIFTDDMLKIKECDLVEHAIDIKPNAKPVRTKTPLYTEEEIAFSAKLIPAMQGAGLIARCDSP